MHPMRRVYPILHILLIASLLVAAIAMAEERDPVATGFFLPPSSLAEDAAVPVALVPDQAAIVALVED